MASVIGRRFFSSTARLCVLKPSLATPAPLLGTAQLTTPELRALAAKAQGPWSQLTKEETISLYRASFPMTYTEIRNQSKGEGMKVLIGVTIGVVLGAGLAQYLRAAVGPELPHTYNNPEWEENTRQKLIKQKANPIEGISSRVKQ